ncbi:hypothetical protein [Chelatococcus reniformis]|uniref:Uncharacterized protein n=1 Tax=Chelatococcus reniformis TaxID=1494448 RepID=A0A916X8N0_9HYPH|nr:hypothetical protein [Chelatococcus reniformis]GGC55090.1 hypothetical protein GCM10010994_12480 [Chelatococcus reniformis]
MVTIIQPAGVPIGVVATAIVSATVAQKSSPAAVLRHLFKAPAQEQRLVAQNRRRV